jgi:hypothetical protein
LRSTCELKIIQKNTSHKISKKSKKLTIIPKTKIEIEIEFLNTTDDVTIVYVLKEREKREIFFHCVVRMRSPTQTIFLSIVEKVKG